MAANANGEYKVFKYYEGLCSSADFPKEIAKVLALGVKSEAVKDLDGNVLEAPFTLKSKNWDIVYPAPDSSLGFAIEEIDGEDAYDAFLEGLTTKEYEDKINSQVAKISDTVILRTRTTEVDLEDIEEDTLTIDSDTNKRSLTMYLEIYKPAYIANPEEYPLDCERKGVIPKLITKELYEKSLRTIIPEQESIYENYTRVENDFAYDGSVADLNRAECESYIRKINAQYGADQFVLTLPTDNAPQYHEISQTILAKIKQSDADLYSLILNTLNNNEGIEPKEYALLEKVRVEISNVNGSYIIMLRGIKKLINYSIPKDEIYYLENIPAGCVPTDSLTPEYYLDGVYIPLEKDAYEVLDGNVSIRFKQDVEFEASTQGVLVVRYSYETDEESIISERATLLNNHYVLMRLFDNINGDRNAPMDNVYNSNGEIVQTNSHISPWTKLSWYRDFEEIMVDTIDADVSLASIHDGTKMVPLETAGLNADTKMRYWINTNNDRFSIIVMGNPSLDYEEDRHVISCCYCGKIDSFENSINDTAGNFALFTSSATEPCNTTLTAEKVENKLDNYLLSDEDVQTGNYDQDAFETFLSQCPCKAICDGVSNTFTFMLGNNNYFSQEKWPQYIIVNSTTKRPATGLKPVFGSPMYDGSAGNNGKRDTLVVQIQDTDVSYGDEYEIYIAVKSYQEKFVITSGVSRDVFGNVIDVDKVKDYGNNTSDGTTSIMMYHTRSKAYYQKHHMMFATTEEYMSKVMYGKSSYTGEYYADRIKVTHGNDGPRGTLSDLLVIDSSSLYALDELVINKDFEKDPDEYEETFVYFPITAPYSPLSDSPNARYGLAIKKQEIEPQYTDENKILKIALNELEQLANEAWNPTDKNIFPRELTSKNGCSVYWSVVDGSAYYVNSTGAKVASEYVPVTLAVINTSQYKGNLENPIEPVTGITVAQGSKIANETESYVAITGFAPNSGETVMYGISDVPIASFGTGAQIKAVLYDGTSENERFEYHINDVPLNGEIGETIEAETKLVDATPDKYLVLYSVKHEVSSDIDEDTLPETYTITKFACVPLKDASHEKNWLLQYPCSINVLTEKGKALYADDNGKLVPFINTSVDYGSEYQLVISPVEGFTLSKVIVEYPDNAALNKEYDAFEDITLNSIVYQGIKIDSVTSDVKIKVQLVTAE